MSAPALGESGSGSSQFYGIPLAAPPVGVRPNFQDPKTNDGVAIGVGIPMAVITVAFCSTRLISNLRSNHKVYWDYAIFISAFILQLAFITTAIITTSHAHHTWDIDLSWLSTSAGISHLKLSYTTSLLSTLSTYLSKLLPLTLLLLLYPTHLTLRALTLFLLTLLTLLYIIIPLAIYSYFCTPASTHHTSPTSSAWAEPVFAKCKDSTLWGLIQGALNVGVDAALVALPLPVVVDGEVWGRGKKWGLGGVFGVGVGAVGVAVGGLFLRVRLDRGGDVVWVEGEVWALQMVENTLVIVCGCLPACYTLVKELGVKDTRGEVEAGRVNMQQAGRQMGGQTDTATPQMMDQRNLCENFYSQVGTASVPRPSQPPVAQQPVQNPAPARVPFRSERYA